MEFRLRNPKDSDKTENLKLQLDRTSLPERIPRQSTPPRPQIRGGMNRAESLALGFIRIMQSNMQEYRKKDASKFQVVNEHQDRYRLSIQLTSFLAMLGNII